MLFKDTIDLITMNNVTNENGVEEPQEANRTTIFANVKSVRQSEFYSASQQGIELQQMFEVRICDYSDQKIIEYEDTLYYVIRTYSKNTEIVELMCSNKARVI